VTGFTPACLEIKKLVTWWQVTDVIVNGFLDRLLAACGPIVTEL